MPLPAIRWKSRSKLSRAPDVGGPAAARLSGIALLRAPLLAAPRPQKGSDKQDAPKGRGQRAAGHRHPDRFSRRSAGSGGEQQGHHAQVKGEGSCRSSAAACPAIPLSMRIAGAAKARRSRGRFRHRRALRPKKYYGLQAGVVDAARRYSPADSSGKQAPASRAPVPYLNVLCRAAKPYASDAATPLHLSCQSFSKKLENHEAAVALHVAHDNLCRVHETPRVTPAVHLSGPGTIGRRETSVIDVQACDFPAP
jgi:hypothetical protein